MLITCIVVTRANKVGSTTEMHYHPFQLEAGTYDFSGYLSWKIGMVHVSMADNNAPKPSNARRQLELNNEDSSF